MHSKLTTHPLPNQGNTAVYLLYAHARIAAIARKAGAGKEPAALLAAGAEVALEHEREVRAAAGVGASEPRICGS